MRDLILLRHAHAGQAAGTADVDRSLSDEGRKEAEAAGRWLKEKGLVPDRALCSPARRTRETLDAVLAVIGEVERKEEAAIYEASAGTLAGLVDQHRDAERLLLVGHNPGLERLAALMHSGQSGDYRGMPPGGVAVLRLPADAVIEPGVATLSEFWWP
ncbi:histidine phosphatase family protein [Luteimonas vadosa]|uniref:Histidine phosphatase family protein n=1 Tax=Luteimonas vadosa TaxID=1165507 RepID=A0ABP9DY32_9GAMM